MFPWLFTKANWSICLAACSTTLTLSEELLYCSGSLTLFVLLLLSWLLVLCSLPSRWSGGLRPPSDRSVPSSTAAYPSQFCVHNSVMLKVRTDNTFNTSSKTYHHLYSYVQYPTRCLLGVACVMECWQLLMIIVDIWEILSRQIYCVLLVYLNNCVIIESN